VQVSTAQLLPVERVGQGAPKIHEAELMPSLRHGFAILGLLVAGCRRPGAAPAVSQAGDGAKADDTLATARSWRT
jgi:hypothetical protein